MPCILVAFSLFVPRLVMFFIYLLTTWFSQAFETVIWPVLGFIFMPYTTLAWMAAMLNNQHKMEGWWIVLLVVAILTDISSAHEAENAK